MAFWAAVQTETRREHVAHHFLGLHGYQLYVPQIRIRRAGSRVPIAQSLFLNYAFVLIELQWHTARWCPGVIRLVMDGQRPAKVPDAAIAALRAQEVGGFVVLPKAPGLRRGDHVRILRGPFVDRLAIYDTMTGKDRVAVLLTLLGGPRRIILAKDDIKVFGET